MTSTFQPILTDARPWRSTTLKGEIYRDHGERLQTWLTGCLSEHRRWQQFGLLRTISKLRARRSS